MRAMLHRRWTNRLSDYLDGSLPDAERARVQAHLAACSACRAVLEELRRVVSAAGRMEPLAPPRDLWPDIERVIRDGARVPPVPEQAPSRGVGALAGQDPHGRAPHVIELPTAARRSDELHGLAAHETSHAAPASSGRRRRIALTAPQLAAAAAGLVALSVIGTRWAAAPGADGAAPSGVLEPSPAIALAADLPDPPAGLAAELSTLERELASARQALDANTLRVLERNMAVIERAIEDSRRALALDPGNEFLSRHLEQVYERKLDYLRQAAAIVDWTD